MNIAPAKSVENPSYATKGITISAARYASEDASTLVHFAIAVLEYSKLCIPLKQAKERVESLRQEQIDYEKRKQEHEAEVTNKTQFLFLFHFQFNLSVWLDKQEDNFDFFK